MRPKRSAARVAAVVMLAVGPTVHAAVSDVSIYKNLIYAQTSTAVPVTPTGTFVGAALVETAATDSTGATVTFTGPSSPLTLTKFGTIFSAGPGFSTQAAMDTAFPFGGNYTFAISGGTLGTQSSAVATPSTALYSSVVPALTGTSYTATQGLNAAASNTLNYNGFTLPAGASVAYTFINVTRTSDGASVFSSGFVSPTATSFTIPANTLTANTAYNLELDYSGRLSGTAFGNVLSTVGFDRRTQIGFTTATPEPASLALAGVGAGIILRRRRR